MNVAFNGYCTIKRPGHECLDLQSGQLCGDEQLFTAFLTGVGVSRRFLVTTDKGTADGETAAASSRFKRCVQSIVRGTRGRGRGRGEISGEPFSAYLNFGWWEMANCVHRRTQDSQVPPRASFNQWRGFKPRAEHYSIQGGGGRTMTICQARCSRGGDRLVNISLELELNSFEMKTYIFPWRCRPRPYAPVY